MPIIRARLLKASSLILTFKSPKNPEPKGYNPSLTQARKIQARLTSTVRVSRPLLFLLQTRHNEALVERQKNQ
jgi:hypothetical protein